MTIHNPMQVDSMVNAQEARILRKKEQQARKHAKRKVLGNYPIWDERRHNYYKERMALRREQRHLFLARGFLAGKHYLSVENRSHSMPCPSLIASTLAEYGIETPTCYIKEWLKP